jgi:hypothetical protein
VTHYCEERVQPPIFTPCVDVVVDGDQPRPVILARLTEDVSVNPPADSPKIFGDHQVELSGFDKFDRAKVLRAIKTLTAALARDHRDIKRQIGVASDPLSINGLLILQAPLILMERADPTYCQCL